MTLVLTDATRAEARQCLRLCRAPRVRSLCEFVATEIVIPEGPYAKQRFRFHRQPYARLAYEAIDSGRFTRFAFPGCVQSGKSFHFWVVPILYHLCEHGENVVVGLPDLQLAHTKWREEIFPVLRQTRYAWMIPDVGRGSRGGVFDELKLRNGATLKFMSGQGSEAKRSSFTARVVVCTEVDKYDRPTASSRGADPATEMEARADAWDFWERRTYLECTVSIESGRIWQEYTNGTASKLVTRCQECGAWVTPEREHLVGWQDAENELDAYEHSRWACPACAVTWDDETRGQMIREHLALVHRGQEIDPDGQVHGEPPRTATLGFRWNAFDNLFWSAGAVGIKEWNAARDEGEAKERELSQFYHVVPFEPPERDVAPLSPQQIESCISRLPRGQCPEDTSELSVGVDLGKRLGHFVVLALRAAGQSHVVDYGEFEIAADSLGVQAATLVALREFQDRCLAGWTHGAAGPLVPQQAWIDSGYYESQDTVYSFTREKQHRDRFRPCKGFGATQQRDKRYQAPSRLSSQVRLIGEQFHFVRLIQKRITLVEINVDYWKTRIHERLRVPAEGPEALTLFYAPKREHARFRSHLLAEKPVEILTPGRPPQIVWEQTGANHYFDALCYATAAAAYCRQAGQLAGDQAAAGGWFAAQSKSSQQQRG